MKNEQNQAKKVADSMKRDGWTFASHSYGHINLKIVQMSKLLKIQKDGKRSGTYCR